MVYGLELKKKIRKVTHSGSNKPMIGFIGTFHRYCVLGHSANAEDTILAGRSAASFSYVGVRTHYDIMLPKDS